MKRSSTTNAHRPSVRRRVRRTPMARMALGLSVLLAVAGTALLAYPAATNHVQGDLQQRLMSRLTTPETRQAYADRTLQIGDSLTRIGIRALGVDVVVVEGTSPSALRAGAGHYPTSPLPGEPGNVAIAGHRTTYGKPFANLDRLRPGDEVVLTTPLGRHTYRVSRAPFVVPNTDWSVVGPRPGHVLTLTTCHPKGSARQRLVVNAELVASSPLEGA